MIFPLKHLPVHWVDGMKLSKDHFVDSAKHVQDLVRYASSIHLNAFNFGLLPASRESKSSFEFFAELSGEQRLIVHLKHCHAITAGGFIIRIDTSHSDNSSLTAMLKGSSDIHHNSPEIRMYDVVLVADPYNRQVSGTPSLEETPPRHPYSDTRYELHILPSEQVNIHELGPYYFIVGKIKQNGGILSLREDYIPACSTVQSHESLEQAYTHCVQRLQEIRDLSFTIIRKVHEKQKPSKLATHFMTLCKDTAQYISAIHYSLIHEFPDQSPMQLIGCISTLASLQYCSLQCLHPEEREELLGYIAEWTDVPPKEADHLLSSAGNLQYTHLDVYPSLRAILDYLRLIEKIWSKLDTLEFIGQRKENIVVAKQTVSLKEEPPKKRWSILD